MAEFIGSLSLWCYLVYIFVIGVHGQCTVQDFRASTRSTYLRLDWSCDQDNNEFQVKYQLLRTGQCNGGENDDSVLDQINTEWLFNEKRIYLYYVREQIYANATYRFAVQPRVWQQDRFEYGVESSINVSTAEALIVDGRYRSPSTGHFEWNPYPYICVNNGVVEYEYQLIRADGNITQEGVTNATELDVPNLECDTDYRFHVTYRTDIGTGPLTWDTISVPLSADSQAPIVQLNATSNTSLSFTWNERPPCNAKIDIVVAYPYELRTYDGYTLVYSGTQMDTFVVFNDLEPDTRYRFRVRVSVESSGDTYEGSWGSLLSATTPTLSSAKSGVKNLQVSVESTYFGIRWESDDLNSEFRVVYKLVEAGYCSDFSADDRRLSPNRGSAWTSSKYVSLQYITYGLYANSTYWISVQSRVFDGRQFVNETQHSGVNEKTPEEIVWTTNAVKYNGFRVQSNGISESCLLYQYNVIRWSDRDIVEDSVTSATELFLTGLECHTVYEFSLRRTMNAKTGPWSDWTYRRVQTLLPDPTISRVRVKAVTRRTILFAWEPLRCNSNNYTITYQYELQLRRSYTVVTEGVTTDTEIMFVDLEFGSEFGFRIFQHLSLPANTIGNTIPWTDWIYVTAGTESYGAAIGGACGALVFVVIIIGLIIMFRKRVITKANHGNQAPNMPKEGGVYEVNLAMGGRQSASEPPEYQNVRHDVAPQSEYQDVNIAEIETEHEYQGLGQVSGHK
ncbi:protogenin B-like [Amphiura filiformis]|uniref:protogenin B-like n=1 Tax=Amphiura filiformis TaxID=82378 RepID=UPI003B224784